MSTDEELLLRIAEAPKRVHDAWDEAVNLGARFGVPLDDLRKRVVRDRVVLAREVLAAADKLRRARPAMPRSAVSRYYYAMYQAMRAVVFLDNHGDDHEDHKSLPSHIPGDFPDQDVRENELKDARERRNAADYDPYPSSATDHKLIAQTMSQTASRFIAECEKYLASKGCVVP